MIINKRVEEVQGQVEYETIWDHDFISDGGTDCEYRNFKNLREFFKLISQETLDEIKDETDCDKVVVSGIAIYGKGDGANFNGYIGERKLDCFISADINNQDIDKRITNNLEVIKKIVENTLSGYPIAYKA